MASDAAPPSPPTEALAALNVNSGGENAATEPQVNGVKPGTPEEAQQPQNVQSPPPAAAVPQQGNAQAHGNTTSLYVGELDPSVTEAMLYEIFSMIGPVSSIRVCRDAVTRRSLGYSYVNYLNASDADRALDQLNYSLIKNKPCRIMVSQRDPALRKTGAGNIFLKNLDENIDNKALHDTFAAFGDILSCKVALDEQGNSKGYGFVHFTTAEAADAAIQNVNGMLLNDKVVFVGHHVPKRERQAKIDEVRSKFTNLYVKNLSPEVDDDEFKEMFSKFGTVTSAVLTKDTDGKSKGFGFVNFEDHEAARKAVDELHEKEYKGLQLYVSRAQKKGEREEELRKAHEQAKYEKTMKYQGVNLYIKNLDDDMNDEKLNAEFAPFGTIVSCKVMTDEKGASKGFGFVCYSSPDEATKAVTELNGKIIGSKPLYVTLAQPKDVRQQQLNAQRESFRAQQLAASGIPQMPPYMQGPPNNMYYPGAQGMQYGRGAPMMGFPGPQQGFPGGPQQQQRRYAPAGQMPMGMPGYPQPYPGYPQPGPGGREMPGMPQGPPQGRFGPGGPQSMQGGMRGPPQGYPQGMMPQQQQQRMPSQGSVGPQQNGTRAGPQGNYKQNQRAAPEPAQQAGSTITAAALASAGPAEQKQMLGEALYPRIHETVPALAGKITGMLLEMDNSELLHLLENEEALSNKVQEAIRVLDEYAKREGKPAA